jgi:hypothetical protein
MSTTALNHTPPPPHAPRRHSAAACSTVVAASRPTLRRPLTHAPSWLQTGAPLWLCDVACTVPSVLLGAAALRGGNAAFLRATEALREERLTLDLSLVLALTQALSLSLTDP